MAVRLLLIVENESFLKNFDNLLTYQFCHLMLKCSQQETIESLTRAPNIGNVMLIVFLISQLRGSLAELYVFMAVRISYFL